MELTVPLPEWAMRDGDLLSSSRVPMHLRGHRCISICQSDRSSR